MPIGYLGYSLSRWADSRSRDAERRAARDGAPAIEPLKPGEDPLAALDPETRELVTSLEPVAPAEAESGIGGRVEGALIGAGLGAFFGAMLANWTPRYQRWHGAGPMDVPMTLACAAIGATIGGVAGWAQGHDPLDRSDAEKVQPLLAASAGADIPTPPAFASLHTAGA
jgi:hypothetical protein